MVIRGSSVEHFKFDGLEIYDYTAARDTECSLAIVEAPPHGGHRKAWSKRSDKYYYVLSGRLRFTVDESTCDLEKGDLCLVSRGQHFSYENTTDEASTLLLFHSPSFDIRAEVFVDSPRPENRGV